jgi:hypothetical protein
VALCGQSNVQYSRGATVRRPSYDYAHVLVRWAGVWGHRQFADEARKGRRVKRGGKAVLLGSATSGVERWQARPYIPHPYTATLARSRTAGRRSIDSAGGRGGNGARGSVSAGRVGDGQRGGEGAIKEAGEGARSPLNTGKGSREGLSGAKKPQIRGTSPSPSRPASRCVRGPSSSPPSPLSCPMTVPSLA